MIFATEADTVRETQLADRMAAAWRCTVHRFSKLSPLDAWLEREHRVIAFAELKTYAHTSDAFACAWLDVSKYVPLWHAAIAFSVPGLYVMAFADRTLWLDVRGIDGMPAPTVTGRSDRGARLDHEPAIRLPIDELRELR